MRAELTIFNRGFALQVNEYDACNDSRKLVAFHWFWKKYMPACSLSLSRSPSGEGTLRFRRGRIHFSIPFDKAWAKATEVQLDYETWLTRAKEVSK